MTTYKVFTCGCRFPTTETGHIIYNAGIKHIPLDCEATWNLISDGNTKGVFQLESNLGSTFAKALKPRSINELSDLVALIRPSCLEGMIDGKSITNHYIDRKHGKEPVKYFHSALESILSETQALLVYQEQAMRIAREIAGFSLIEADDLRKAIGKKKTDLMASLKNKFIDMATAKGVVTKEESIEIFDWIEKAQRYSFNASHSVAYAMNAYITAYAKAHFPIEFFTSYLAHAIGKPDTYKEIHDLINNAKQMGIDIKGPDIRNLNMHFEIINNAPTFGLVDIKKFGKSAFIKLKQFIDNNNINISELSWIQFLFLFAKTINKQAFEALIYAGALDYFNIDRKVLLHEFNIVKDFGPREFAWAVDNHEETLLKTIHKMVYISESLPPKERPIYRTDKIAKYNDIYKLLKDSPYELKDSPSWIASIEAEYLGYPLTCIKLDEKDTGDANCTCKEFYDGYKLKTYRMAVEIKEVKEYKIKNGKHIGETMAFIEAFDSTCSLNNIAIFSEAYTLYKPYLVPEATVLLIGERDNKKNGFIIQKVRDL